ncbi:MAG TPA: FUSC family protein [Prosthecobacter sp.]
MKFLAERFELDRSGVVHALQLTLAAGLAFAVAAAFHVQNAYWAAMPIWVVAQPTRGLLLERAFFRILGTLLGVAVGFLLLHITSQAHWQLAGFAAWIGLCAAGIHLLRGVHAYGALMGGITAAIVILPAALDPMHSMDRALARVECTLIGVVAVTLVTGFFTPASGRQVFYQKVRQLAADAVGFAVAVLEGRASDEDERKLLVEMSDVDASASLVSAGSIEGYRRLHHVHALVIASMEVMAAARAVHGQMASRNQPDEISPLAQSLASLAERLRQTTESVEMPRELAFPPLSAPARLSQALENLRQADETLRLEPSEADARSFRKKAVYLAPHRNTALAWQMGLLCGALAFIAALTGLETRSHAALLTAIGITIFSLILSSVPLPQALAPKILKGVLAGTLAAVFYRLAIQPHLSTLPQLVISVLPFMFIGSLARASKRLADSGLEGTMCFMFASQAGMPAALPVSIWTDAACLITGAVVVTGGFRLLPRQPLRQAQRAAREIVQDLHRLLHHPQPEWHPHTSRQLMRLSVHLGRAGELGDAAPRGLLAALNLGHAIAGLQAAAAAHQSPPEAAQALQSLTNFEKNPEVTANELKSLAAASQSLSEPLQAAATALRESQGLLEFAAPGQR